MPAPLHERDTYQIGPDCDMRTWRTENGRTVYLGEPLWSCCDQPVADGDCGCIRPVTLSPIMPETEEFYRNASLEEWEAMVAIKYGEAAE